MGHVFDGPVASPTVAHVAPRLRFLPPAPPSISAEPPLRVFHPAECESRSDIAYTPSCSQPELRPQFCEQDAIFVGHVFHVPVHNRATAGQAKGCFGELWLYFARREMRHFVGRTSLSVRVKNSKSNGRGRPSYASIYPREVEQLGRRVEATRIAHKRPPRLRFLSVWRSSLSSEFTPKCMNFARPSSDTGRVENVPHGQRIHHDPVHRTGGTVPRGGEPPQQALSDQECDSAEHQTEALDSSVTAYGWGEVSVSLLIISVIIHKSVDVYESALLN